MPQMTRNLSIRSKLLALLAVPVAASALLGVAGVAAAWADRARAAGDHRLAAVAIQAATAAHELQEERVQAVALTAAGEGAGRPGQVPRAARADQGDPAAQAELAARRRRVDRVVAAYRAGAAGLGATGDPALDQAVAAAAGRLDRLAVLRAEVDRRLLPPDQVAADHDAAVAALLVAARGLAGRLDAPQPARTARLLLAVADAKEATGQERTLLAEHPTLPSGAAAGQELRLRLAAAAAVARDGLNAVRAVAGDRLGGIDQALAGPGARQARGLELALLEPAGNRRGVGALEGWRDGLAARAGALRRLERAAGADLAAAAAAGSGRQDRRVNDRLALAAAAVLASLAAALLALRVAAGHQERPAAPGGTVPGLARRGQALADRQLQLLEDLARDEPDPHRRQGLLGVDHLANRLLRTAETLLAVAGEPARRGARPLPVAALLRAAVGEAEPGGSRPDGPPGAGRRVDLLTTGEVEVDAAAGADLVHLLAELLDNAAAFSPPAAPIVVTGAADGDGYLIEVSDRGLGMTDQELSWANQRLAGGVRPGAAAGDRLGLAVAGRLAARNGFGVRLGRSPAGGVTAVVRLPAARLAVPAQVPARPS